MCAHTQQSVCGYIKPFNIDIIWNVSARGGVTPLASRESIDSLQVANPIARLTGF